LPVSSCAREYQQVDVIGSARRSRSQSDGSAKWSTPRRRPPPFPWNCPSTVPNAALSCFPAPLVHFSKSHSRGELLPASGPIPIPPLRAPSGTSGTWYEVCRGPPFPRSPEHISTRPSRVQLSKGCCLVINIVKSRYLVSPAPRLGVSYPSLSHPLPCRSSGRCVMEVFVLGRLQHNTDVTVLGRSLGCSSSAASTQDATQCSSLAGSSQYSCHSEN
jgi:hypothetical protein